jgi:hypothetical protein
MAPKTTYKDLTAAYDVLSYAINSYSQARNGKTSEAQAIRHALGKLNVMLLAKPRKGAAENFYPSAHALADKARQVVKLHTEREQESTERVLYTTLTDETAGLLDRLNAADALVEMGHEKDWAHSFLFSFGPVYMEAEELEAAHLYHQATMS